MKISITKTRIKELHEALKGNKGKDKLYQRCNLRTEVSFSYINQLIKADGEMPSGVTDKVKIVFEEAEKLVAERAKEAKKIKEAKGG